MAGVPLLSNRTSPGEARNMWLVLSGVALEALSQLWDRVYLITVLELVLPGVALEGRNIHHTAIHYRAAG